VLERDFAVAIRRPAKVLDGGTMILLTAYGLGQKGMIGVASGKSRRSRAMPDRQVNWCNTVYVRGLDTCIVFECPPMRKPILWDCGCKYRHNFSRRDVQSFVKRGQWYVITKSEAKRFMKRSET